MRALRALYFLPLLLSSGVGQHYDSPEIRPLMRLSLSQADANGGATLLSNSGALQQLTQSLQRVDTTTQKLFTASLTKLLRDPTRGWRASELPYTPIQPQGRGRPRAIDFFHDVERTAIELELSNQTCFSHDLLKLETAFRHGYIMSAAIITIHDSAAHSLNWRRKGNNSYLTFETASTFLAVFAPALSVPILLRGLEM